MRAPSFWQKRGSPAGIMLAPLGAVYLALAYLRSIAAKPHKAAATVICVGNVTMGGAGKTPAVLALAKLFRDQGKNPAILTRGYKGRLDNLIVKPEHTARDVGDEAIMLARRFPTIVARNRSKGAELAKTINADVIIMDDGFQNPTLFKDKSVLVFDGFVGIGNGMVFPAGPLRERFVPALKRAAGAIIVGEDRTGIAPAISAHIPVLEAHMVLDDGAVQSLRGKGTIAFAGIGRPEKFFRSLAQAGIDLKQATGFADHHCYSEKDIQALLDKANRTGCVLATTEKDSVKIPKGFAQHITAVPAVLEIPRHDNLLELLKVDENA
ncbi:MAG: tetraacyldisaccharide 4'-kinase [Alphaproteobacteria bacterium]|nr:tetraacyldisaccharide 4'-kinase [Alphaproteobacteria bacterium]